MKSKNQKRIEAAVRQAARDRRTAQDQLAQLNARGSRAKRERRRLERQLDQKPQRAVA